LRFGQKTVKKNSQNRTKYLQHLTKISVKASSHHVVESSPLLTSHTVTCPFFVHACAASSSSSTCTRSRSAAAAPPPPPLALREWASWPCALSALEDLLQQAKLAAEERCVLWRWLCEGQPCNRHGQGDAASAMRA
jgi:hypothetical protein